MNRFHQFVLMHLLAAVANAGEASPPTFPDSAYVRVSSEGHLELAGQRVRYWGWIGHFWLQGPLEVNRLAPDDSAEIRQTKIAKTKRVMDALAQRIHDLGFNMVRFWGTQGWSDAAYTIGDGSAADITAFSLAALEKRGIKVWMTGLGDNGNPTVDDLHVIDDPASAAGWTAAMGELTQLAKDQQVDMRQSGVIAWDPRLMAVAKRAHERIADWPNKYKGGLRLGDDPQIAVWELSNEEWWFSHLVNGHWQKLPTFFKDEMSSAWNGFLRKKYGSDKHVIAAWQFLMPGETLTTGSVLLAPLASPVSTTTFNDANPAALAALTAGRQAFTREDFTSRRAQDVLEFLIERMLLYKSTLRDHAKTLGRSLALSPLVLDTGDGFRIQSVLLHQQGDAAAMCTYLWQTATDRQQPSFPFESGLAEPPRMAMGIPWAEIGRIPGKPFFIYETQTANPDKYRAEFPFRIAALGAIQDWDIVNWHIFGRPDDPDGPAPYSGALAYSHAGDGVEGLHYKNDEVLAGAMRTAGALFTTGALRTVAKPTTITFGKRALFDPISADYGRSFGALGSKLTATTYRYGLRMQVDPTAVDDVVVGPLAERGLHEACPVQPTNEISYDWKRGSLTLDAPTGVAFIGCFGVGRNPVRFANGVDLKSALVVNPPGMPYPVSVDETYLAFSAVATDALPLATSRSVVISLGSTSFNSDFLLDPEQVAKGKPYVNMQGGKAPVLVARVTAIIDPGPLRGMRYRLLDWQRHELGTGIIEGPTWTIPAYLPIFLIECTR